jgi:hypothetical protein
MIGGFSLPPLGGGEPPAFATAGACREWLNALPLANPGQAQALLLAQVDRLNRFALGVGERLRIMELLRESAAFVQSECAKKFAARPLPLVPAEQSGFEANGRLWQSLCVGYQRCIEACLEGEPEVLSEGALVVQRALWALAGEQADTYRGWQEMQPAFWRRLHATFAVGEQLGADQQPVRDLLLETRSTTVHAAYTSCLLLHAASPYELTPRQFAQVQRWLARWSGKVKLSKARPQAFKLPPLVVDVAGEHPGIQRPEPGGNLRWLDVDGLAHSLKKRIVALQKGATGAALGLGEDCVQPACELLLKHVFDRCCRGGIARGHVRNSPEDSHCRLVSGMEAIYFRIFGKAFQQPASADELSKRQHDEIALFGQTAKRFDDQYVRQQELQLEQWRIVDESAGGLRLSRPAVQPGQRIAAGQLLALQPPGSAGLRLGSVRWMTHLANGDLQMGVRMMPGAPQAISVCATGLSSVVGPRCRPGFRLPAVEALQCPASVVFPAAAFRVDRIVEILAEHSVQIRIKRIVEHGFDFERAEYEAP